MSDENKDKPNEINHIWVVRDAATGDRLGQIIHHDEGTAHATAAYLLNKKEDQIKLEDAGETIKKCCGQV